VSTIDRLPPGRKPIATKLVDASRRDEVIARVRKAVAVGRQAYWVCPLVEQADDEPAAAQLDGVAPPKKRSATRIAQAERLELQAAVETHASLSAALPGIEVGLVHGRLPNADKVDAMRRFAAGEIGVLVATTVIEVGVDVPNASLMVIEHAERFGLAQLHQLRGRVGRGTAESACILLFQPPLSATAKERLKTMRETQDGFAIAKKDLELRGPGEFLGHRQSGDALLRFADLQSDQALVDAARETAVEMLASHPLDVERHLQRWLRGAEELLKA
jgi:ATP-dependent DNA helicase RecG